jgi:integrase
MKADTQISSLFRRPTANGDKWVVSGRIKGGNPTKITIGYCSIISVTEARKIAKQHLAEMAQGINPNHRNKLIAAKGKTLQEALEKYLQEKGSHLKPNTVKSYTGTITRNFSGWLDRPIASITAQDCVTRYRQIRDEVAKRGVQIRKANEPGEAEAQKAMRSLSAVLSYFANDMLPDNSGRLLPHGNPVEGLKDKRIRRKLESRKRALSFEERIELLDFLTHPSNWQSISEDHCHWIIILLCTGLRHDEPLNLTWSDVDFINKTFTITQTKNGKPLTLPMTKRINNILLSRKMHSNNSSSYVFPQKTNPKKPATMNRVCQRISRLCNIEFTAHDLRRTTATALNELGYSIEDIGRILNHRRTSITDEYIQTSTEQLRKALEELEYMLFDVMWDETIGTA